MTTFTVDPASLAALESTISGIAGELNNMNKLDDSFSGQVGGGDLEGSIRNFLDAWHSGVGLISGDIQKVVQRLAQASQAYGQAETFISQASCPSSGG